MNLMELLKHLQAEMQYMSDTARLDAEMILIHALQAPRTIIYSYAERPISLDEQTLILSLLKRRLQGEPMAYLLGEKEFWSLTLEVTPDTLIPRPETEHLIEWALTHLPAKVPLNIVDLGTGAGSIALALAHERPHWQIHATDTSFAALSIAIRNAQRLRLNNISFYQGDWLHALPDVLFDAIFSNPPYIAETGHHLKQIGLQFEPQNALVSGVQGLDALRNIISNSTAYLKPKGWLVLEHGYNQANAVFALLDAAGFEHIQNYPDLAGLPRFTVGQRSHQN